MGLRGNTKKYAFLLLLLLLLTGCGRADTQDVSSFADDRHL